MSAEEIRNTDDAKGRVKEAAGNLTGDKDLKREGQVDQAGGKAKNGIEKLTDKVKDVLRRD
ncbi:MAG: CsbD family protein [Solirubrobacterales bacterium]